MKPKALAAFLSISVPIACGGSSTTPSPTPNPSPPPPPPLPAGTWVDAQPTTIGEVAANPNGANTIPFGSNSVAGPSYPATTYQQVYAGSLFGSGQVRLTSIEFFPHPRDRDRGFQPLPANYTVSLSTTAKAVNGLDTANLASNVGADQQVVFSGALGPGTIVNGQFQIAFAAPFSFRPSSGNLLVQILRSNPMSTFGVGLLVHEPNDGYPAGQSSRAHDWGTGYAGFFLVTRFEQQRCECPPGQQCAC